jgi:general secretion pathway protein G
MPNTNDTRLQHRLARQRREGMTLIEIMIVITIIALIGGGVAVALLPQLNKAQIDSTKIDADKLRSVVQLYVGQNPRECPTVEQLVSERYLDGSRREISVRSAGPDLEFNTEDDIF